MDPSILPVKLQASNLRPIAYRILSKKHGLNVKTDALKFLTETIGNRFGSDWKGPQSQLFLEDIARIWKVQDRGLFIDGEGLKQVINEMTKSGRSSTSSSFSGGKSKSEAAAVAGRSDTIVDNSNSEVLETVEVDVDVAQVDEDGLNWKDYFKIVTADSQPKYQIDKVRKQFYLIPPLQSSSEFELGATLNAKVNFFINRYSLLSDRLARNENFQKPTFLSMTSFHTTKGNNSGSLSRNSSSHEITLIKNLLGRDGKKFILFGLLSQNSNGDYTLEDSTDSIVLNITQAFKTEGSYYCPGMFLVVEGIYSASGGVTSSAANIIGGCFHVSNIGHPPAEKREVSLENYGNLDFMGIHDTESLTNHISRIDKAFKKKLTSIEKQLVDHRLIIMGSDCFLDKLKTMEGLSKFFSKLELRIENGDYQPLAIIFTGSYASTPLTATNTSSTAIPNSASYKNNFDSLATLVSKFPNIVANVKFIILPGSNDPWQSTFALGGSSTTIWPQSPIPSIFTNRLARVLPKGNLLIGWNPIRINYLSQEIAIARDDICQKLKRNDIIFQSEMELEKENLQRDKEREREGKGQEIDIEEILSKSESTVPLKIQQARKLVKTVLDQGNLQPFKMDLKVFRPYYDHVLRLEPLPTILILNDSTCNSFEVTYNGCKVVNVGSLIGTSRKLNYAEYQPSSKRFSFKEVFF